MEAGYDTVPLPCKFARIPAVFGFASCSDRLVKDYRATGEFNAIGALVAEATSPQVNDTADNSDEFSNMCSDNERETCLTPSACPSYRQDLG